jgi:hypothetical protein
MAGRRFTKRIDRFDRRLEPVKQRRSCTSSRSPASVGATLRVVRFNKRTPR